MEHCNVYESCTRNSTTCRCDCAWCIELTKNRTIATLRDKLAAAEAQLAAASARADAAEKALRAIADGDAGHSGAFEWPEFYESIREFAREALAAERDSGTAATAGKEGT